MGFFEIIGRLISGFVVSVWLFFVLWLAGDKARGGGPWWKAVLAGFWIWMCLLAVSFSIAMVYAEIFGPFVQAIF